MSTRSRIGAALLAAPVAALLALSGCGAPAGPGGQPLAAQPAADAAPTGVQEFVGPVGAGPFYIAVALRPGGAVEAYVCDGTGQAENFTGTLTGDTAQLTSADGDSTLTARTSANTVTGTFVRQGRPGDFAAPKVRGAGGLYDFDVTTAGSQVRLTGASRGGNTATTTISGNTATGTITLASGGTAPLDPMAGKSPDAVNDFEAYRVLIADDGSRRGNPKPGARKVTGGSSFTCPILFG